MGESLEDLQSASGSLLKKIGNIVGKAIEGTEIEPFIQALRDEVAWFKNVSGTAKLMEKRLTRTNMILSRHADAAKYMNVAAKKFRKSLIDLRGYRASVEENSDQWLKLADQIIRLQKKSGGKGQESKIEQLHKEAEKYASRRTKLIQDAQKAYEKAFKAAEIMGKISLK
jgi:chitinase